MSGKVLEAVVRGDKDEACDRPLTSQVNRDSTSQTPAYNDDVWMFGSQFVEQGERISEESRF